MPIYEFLCRDCDNRFDDLVSMHEVDAQTCPDCRSGDVVKLYSPFAVHAKAGAGSASMAMAGGGGACMPGPAGGGGGGGCCGGGCGGCG